MSGNNNIPDFVQDPCQKNNHMTILLNNTLIALGGYDVTSPLNGADRVTLTSSYIRTFDFSRSIDLYQTPSSDKSFQKLYHLPSRMPYVRWPVFWASTDGKTLYLWGGEHEIFPIMIEVDSGGKPIMSNSTRPVIDSNVWQVDATDLSNENSWRSTQSNLVNNPVPLSRSTFAIDNWGQVYIYGGVYEVLQYFLAKAWYEPVPQFSLEKADLITIDNRSPGPPTVANNTLTTSPIGNMLQGAMHYISTAGKQGVMVLFGGEGPSETNIDIKKTWIYDIATKKWYLQPTTGHYPQNRLQFCSVLVSSEDGSSHSIFVTGGWQRPNEDTLAFDDVYVLSIPSFQWIYIGKAGVAKIGPSCNRIGKYLIMYGGRRNDNSIGYNECTRDSIMQFYDMESLEWTSKFDYGASKDPWKVPKAIYSVIGGNENGGATVLTPKGGFAYTDLQAIFKFTSTSSPGGNTTLHTSIPSSSSGSTSSNSRNVGAIVGGVIGGIVALFGVLVTLFLIRRKRQRKQHEPPSGYSLSLRPGDKGQGISLVEAPPMEPSEMGHEPAVEMDGMHRGELEGSNVPEMR